MTGLQSFAAIVRQVLVDARRGKLAWLAAGAAVLALLLAGFLSQVALAEARQLQAALAAALLRACAVFLIAGYVVTSTVRDYHDKALDLYLALPISRRTYYLGKLAGFALVGALMATLFSLALLPWAASRDVLLWGLSLALETLLAACLALFFAVAFTQVLPALAGTAGLYLLGRSIAAIQAIARSPLAEDSAPERLARWIADALSLLLPRLDLATRTDWLLYGAPGAASYLSVLGGLACYALLLTAAGLFDFHRRNL